MRRADRPVFSAAIRVVPAEPRKQAPQSLGFRERLTGPKYSKRLRRKCLMPEVARVVFLANLVPRSEYDSRAWRGGADQIAVNPQIVSRHAARGEPLFKAFSDHRT
jgi:hypothetical protein